jgi:hypothetical protein
LAAFPMVSEVVGSSPLGSHAISFIRPVTNSDV